MTIGFTGSPLLRLDRERPDPAVFARHRDDPAARVLVLDGLDPVPDEGGGLRWAPLVDLDPALELALLGVLFPVLDPALRRRVIEEGLRPYLEDNTHSWILHRDGTYRRQTPGPRAARSAQQWLMNTLVT